MKCPKCGFELKEPDWKREVRFNRLLIGASAAVLIATLLITLLMLLPATSPRPSLIGDFDTSDVSWYASDGNYTLGVWGYVYNEGPVGCFANVTVQLSDSRGWIWEKTFPIGWLPAGGVSPFIGSEFGYPVTYEGMEADLGTMHEDIRVTLEYEFFDPTYDNRSQ